MSRVSLKLSPLLTNDILEDQAGENETTPHKRQRRQIEKDVVVFFHCFSISPAYPQLSFIVCFGITLTFYCFCGILKEYNVSMLVSLFFLSKNFVS